MMIPLRKAVAMDVDTPMPNKRLIQAARQRGHFGMSTSTTPGMIQPAPFFTARAVF